MLTEVFDSQEAFALAKQRLPMDVLLPLIGLGEYVDRKAAAKLDCPFCQTKGKFGIRQMGQFWVYKCFQVGCAAEPDTRRKDEIGIIALKTGLDLKAAASEYLRLAEVKIVPKPLPPRRKRPEKLEEPAPSKPAPKEDPALQVEATHEEEINELRGEEEQPLLIVGPVARDDESIADLAEPAGAPGSGEPPAERPPGPLLPPIGKRNVWETFFSRISLSEKDRSALRRQRGFSDEVITELGFRSSNRSNEIALNSLRGEFSDRDLLKSGLFRKSRGGPKGIEIETQFTGWGITGKKKNNQGEDVAEWGWTERPLIPYLDEHGRIQFMRPHKGNPAKRNAADDEECTGHVYCDYLLAKRIEEFDGLCVLTESEFKAGAIYQAGFPAIGIPGITFIRNWTFRMELVKMLEYFKITDLIIVFDNEVKDNPALPTYKADPQSRYDAIVYARYMAWDLMSVTPRPGFLKSVRIGRLPDEWRLDDEGRDTGKVDWDTALARFVRQADGNVTLGTSRARIGFGKVIEEAVTSNEFIDFFSDECTNIVEQKINNLFHKPLLLSGGDDQVALAARFDKVRPPSSKRLVEIARRMSTALRSVAGCYFERKIPSDKQQAYLYETKTVLDDAIDKLTEANNPTDDAEIERYRLESRLIKECLTGLPQAVSNFKLKCEYCMMGVNGRTDRMIRFKNNQKETTKLLRVPAEAFSKLGDWRTYCNASTEGVAVWMGSEKNLQSLVMDMKHWSAHRNVYEVAHYGFDPKSKLWFFGDVAFPHDGGPQIHADDNNFFWYNGLGYQVDVSREERGKHFDQGAPLLLPENHPHSQPVDILELFTEFSNELFLTVGDWDACMAIGMIFSYAIMPEIYREYGGCGGLWLYGQRGGGKNAIMRRFARCWGFDDLTGINLSKGTTPVGLQRTLSQYSNMFLWFDEYQRDIDEQKVRVIQAAYDRTSMTKGRMEHSNRTNKAPSLTTPVITGESSSHDGATRSRYCHLIISKARRFKEGFRERHTKLEKLSRNFYQFGLHIMQNRTKFAEHAARRMKEWLDDEQVMARITDDRTRNVHGTGYACFCAFQDLLDESVMALRNDRFISYMVTHAVNAMRDVQEETKLTKFWAGMISAVQRELIRRTFFEVREAQFHADGTMHENDRNELTGVPVEKVLYMAAQPVFDDYAESLRRRGEDILLSKSDIHREISREPYFVRPAARADGQEIHRTTLGGYRGACWVIRLSKFPMAEDIVDAITTEQERTAGY